MNGNTSKAQALPIPFFFKILEFLKINSRLAFISLSCLTIFLFVTSIYVSSLTVPIPAIQSKISATTAGIDDKNNIDIVELDPGRFRIAVKDFSGPLELNFEMFGNAPKAKNLLVRRGIDRFERDFVKKIRVSTASKDLIIDSPSETYTPRHILALDKPNTSNALTLSIENLDQKSSILIIDEIGLYENSPNHFEISNYPLLKTIVKILRLFVSLLGIFLIANLRGKKSTFLGILYVIALGFATYSSIIFVKFSPEWTRDLKVIFASGNLQRGIDHFFYYGLSMAQSILEGKGPLIDGVPPWCRMPGYGFLLALVKSGTSDTIESFLNATIRGIWFHLFLTVSSLTFLFWTLQRLVSPLAAVAAVTGILLLPSGTMFLLVIESIMPAVAVFSLGTACIFLWHNYRTTDRTVLLRYHVLLHLSFAIWFFMRTDILPGWAIVSAILYGPRIRTWKYFLIPTCFMLGIGLSWAAFKYPYLGNFSMTTESVGASFMIGLWEVPHKLVWNISDPAYFTWIESFGLDYKTKLASDIAVKECLRFCFTFPIYLLSLIWHKFTVMLHIDRMGMPILFLMTIPVIAIMTKYKRTQALLLSWMIFFNMPLFFIFYSSGSRFYDPAFISMIVVGCAFLFDKNFYHHISSQANAKRVYFMFAISASIFLFGQKLDSSLIQKDEWRYWSPYLDPTKSTLYILPTKENPKM